MPLTTLMGLLLCLVFVAGKDLEEERKREGGREGREGSIVSLVDRRLPWQSEMTSSTGWPSRRLKSGSSRRR